ncbi:MAG: glycosyltransferase family 4 protein [Mariprofundaceae bacterium]
MKLLHIVRRYGPVGGMESYVWQLTQELALMGHDVTVLCERQEHEPPASVKVYALGEIAPKPRWLSHIRFSHRVSRWVRQHPASKRIIHSHERTSVHHVTTFHGPPFAHVLEKPWWKRASLRVRVNLWLEKREVCDKHVQAVIPNSTVIAKSLDRFYPCIGQRLKAPITPGVVEGPKRPDRAVPEDGGVIGFIGKEWQRKGLDLAIRIVGELRRKRPDLTFLVAGPAPEDVQHLFADWDGGYQLLGETDTSVLYPQLDLLLHPARHEPYGMVVAEALAASVPVLISDHCGVKEDVPDHTVLELDSDILLWAQRCEALIGTQPEPFHRLWKDTAEEQLHCYRKLSAKPEKARDDEGSAT